MDTSTSLIGEYGNNKCYIIDRKFQNCHTYGILLENLNDESYITGMFEDKVEAEKFAELLINKDVSPLHLYEIADDYMSAFFYEN